MACFVHYEVVPIAQAMSAQSAAAASAAASAALAAVAVVGIGVASYVAYREARRLASAYTETLQSLSIQRQEEDNRQQAIRQLSLAGEHSALSLAAETHLQASQDAMREFVHQQVCRLLERVETSSDPNGPKLAARAHALLSALDAHLETITAHWRVYTQLQQDATTIDQHHHELAQAAADAIAQLRDDITVSPLATAEHDALRVEMLHRLEALAALPARQRELVMQSIALLRQRYERELAMCMEEQMHRIERARIFRETVNDMLAKLHAINEQTLQPDYRERAYSLLTYIEDGISGFSIDALTTLAQEAASLYTACQQSLDQVTATAFVQEQLCATIITEGVPVLAVTGETAGVSSVIAGFTSELGIEFHFERQGSIRAELVALNEEAANVYPETIEEGLALADQIIAALPEHGCQIRERYRHLHKHPEGHRLRVARQADQPESYPFQTGTVAPRRMPLP